MGKQQEIKVFLRYFEVWGSNHVNKVTSASLIINMETEQKFLDFPKLFKKEVLHLLVLLLISHNHYSHVSISFIN